MKLVTVISRYPLIYSSSSRIRLRAMSCCGPIEFGPFGLGVRLGGDVFELVNYRLLFTTSLLRGRKQPCDSVTTEG